MPDFSESVYHRDVTVDNTVVKLRCRSSTLSRIEVRANTTDCYDGSYARNVATVLAPRDKFETLRDTPLNVCFALLSVDAANRVTYFDYSVSP